MVARTVQRPRQPAGKCTAVDGFTSTVSPVSRT
jgi:hypothetical protein